MSKGNEEYKKYEPVFGAWYLGKMLGKGSFGKVFEITREEFGETYKAALKVISVPQDDEDVKARLSGGTDTETISEYYKELLKEIANENRIMTQLKGNSNIVSYEDHQIIPHDDGIGYDILIRMELLTPLVDRMIERNLSKEETIKLGIDICRALELCHRKNIIHRDIKPQNILISDNGDFKLGDFGISRTMEKTTGGMSKKGTYKYMAPEVFRGEDYDSTADIYSLGIVLYMLLNGNRTPFLPQAPERIRSAPPASKVPFAASIPRQRAAPRISAAPYSFASTPFSPRASKSFLSSALTFAPLSANSFIKGRLLVPMPMKATVLPLIPSKKRFTEVFTKIPLS